MEILPRDENQARFVYNAMMTLTTGVASWFVHSWLPFFVFTFWSGVWFYDLYLRPYFFPETEVDQQTYMEQQFLEYMNRVGDNSKMAAEIARLRKRVEDLDG